MQALHNCSSSGYVRISFSEGPADDLEIWWLLKLVDFRTC